MSRLTLILLAAPSVCATGGFAAEPLRALTWDVPSVPHLLSRACFGGDPERPRKLAVSPLDEAVDQLLS